MKVAALRFTHKAKQRIEETGGSCLTLDQFVGACPKGSGALLLRGSTNKREANKHFRGDHAMGKRAKPYVISKGRKFERATGRRKSRGWKLRKN